MIIATLFTILYLFPLIFGVILFWFIDKEYINETIGNIVLMHLLFVVPLINLFMFPYAWSIISEWKPFPAVPTNNESTKDIL